MEVRKLFGLHWRRPPKRILGNISAWLSRQRRPVMTTARLVLYPIRQDLLRVALVVLVMAAIGFLTWIGYGHDWTGFRTRTLWDWLDLAVVPLSLAFGAFLLNRAASARDRQLASEREFYALLGPLLPREGSMASLRVFIFSTLDSLDPDRKVQILRALYEAGLISDKSPAIDLRGANFRGVNLRGMKLQHANLSGADLRGADLSNTDLQFAILQDTDLTGASSWHGKTVLAQALLEGTNLTRARLARADLCRATLAWPTLDGTDLRGADLRGAQVVEIARFTDVDLRKAQLQGASLSASTFGPGVRWDGALYSTQTTTWPPGFQPPPQARSIEQWWPERATELRSKGNN